MYQCTPFYVDKEEYAGAKIHIIKKFVIKTDPFRFSSYLCVEIMAA